MPPSQGFLRGAAILATAGFVSRVLGVFGVVVLPRLLTDAGMGLLHMVRPAFQAAAILAVSGLPAAVTKVISEQAARRDLRAIRTTFRLSLALAIGTGTLAAAGLWIAAGVLTDVVLQDRGAYLAAVASAPALLFIALASSFRGFFEGLQEMVPVALSEVWEQVVRVAASIGLVYLLLPKGLELAVAGASIAGLLGNVVSLAVLGWYYPGSMALLRSGTQPPPAAPARLYGLRAGGRGRALAPDSAPRPQTAQLIARLWQIAFPLFIGMLSYPALQLIDTVTVPSRLRAAGFDAEAIRQAYGYLGMAHSLVHFPNVITMALAASLLPAVSEAVALGRPDLARMRIQEALRVTVALCLPSSIGFLVLAEPLSRLVFGYPQTAVPLSALAFATLAIGLQQVSSGVLMGLDRVGVAVRALWVGTLVKLVVNHLLTGIPAVGIRGPALGTLAGFTVAALLNLAAIVRHTGLNPEPERLLGRPLTASLLMAVLVLAARAAAQALLSPFLAPGPAAGLATVAAVAAGIAVYFPILARMGGVNRRDFEALPGVGPWMWGWVGRLVRAGPGRPGGP